MTNSRSNRVGVATAAVIAAIVAVAVVAPGVAEAGRKRVVVLDFEGPKAEKFHDDMVKLVKKSYTVIPTDKWNGTAEELDATGSTDKNLKKVAAKLKVDAVITGKIEKRRDDYLIHLKLRAGKTGEVSKPVETKSSGPRIDGKASTDIKDELVDAIEGMDTKAGASDDGGGDDGGDDTATTTTKKKKPAVKKSGGGDDDDGDDTVATTKKKKPAVKKGGGDDDSGNDGDDDAGATPKHKGFSKHGGDDEVGGSKVATTKKKKPVDDDAGGDDGDSKPDTKKKATTKKVAVKDDGDDGDSKPDTKKKKPAAAKDDGGGGGDGDGGDDDGGGGGKKKVAAKDDGDGGGGDAGDGTEVTKASGDDDSGPLDPAAALSPGQRAVDADLGLSVLDRQLKFKFTSGLQNSPPGYRGVPVAGAYIDGAFYPLALGHKRKGLATGLGVTFSFDRVLHVSSQVKFIDDMGTAQTATLETKAQRYSIGAIFRYPLSTAATAPVVTAELRYSQQSFLIAQTIPGTMDTTSDIPNVTYSMIEPMAGIKYPASDKLTLLANAGVEVITGAGGISEPGQYGTAKALGIEGGGGVDYMVTKNVFARAMFRAETIGLTFEGKGTLTMRGGDTTVDVQGARDTYFGGAVTVGYVY
jgi:hypothetical protein|nr:hypothetical protein [Kofleriaceae bacterium]